MLLHACTLISELLMGTKYWIFPVLHLSQAENTWIPNIHQGSRVSLRRGATTSFNSAHSKAQSKELPPIEKTVKENAAFMGSQWESLSMCLKQLALGCIGCWMLTEHEQNYVLSQKRISQGNNVWFLTKLSITGWTNSYTDLGDHKS